MASSSDPSRFTPGGTKRKANPASGASAEPPKTPRLTAEMAEEVQCPICLEVPLDAILQCVNGCTVCQSCQEKTGRDTCGQCQDKTKFPDGRWMRSRALEKVLDRMSIPCRFQDRGCSAVLPRGELRQHLQECDKSGNVIRICHHFRRGKDCDFKINCTKPQEAFQHLRDRHDAVSTDKATMVLRRMGSTKRLVLLPWVDEGAEERDRHYLLAISADHPDNAVNYVALSLNEVEEDRKTIKITFKSTSNQAADMSIEIPVVPFPNVAAALEGPAPVRVTLSILKEHYQNQEEKVEMQISMT